MPFLLVIAGVVAVMLAYHNNVTAGLQLARDEAVGKQGGSTWGFASWALAITMIGSMGAVAELRAFSNALLWLIFIVLALSNNSGIAKLVGGAK